MPKCKPLTVCGLCPFNPRVLDYTTRVGAPTVSMSTAYSKRLILPQSLGELRNLGKWRNFCLVNMRISPLFCTVGVSAHKYGRRWFPWNCWSYTATPELSSDPLDIPTGIHDREDRTAADYNRNLGNQTPKEYINIKYLQVEQPTRCLCLQNNLWEVEPCVMPDFFYVAWYA